MDGQVEKASWSLPKGLASQIMPGEILEGLKQNKVLAL